ncbi:MAG TPA: hypothetical protein VFI73_05950 [Candidatus Nitrosopolaris sp.]|nr:hypothetical protein [Candidatus Nitrosopolaris sp.]
MLEYTIAKKKGEDDRMKYYALVIRKLREELGSPPANFAQLDLDREI